MITSALDKFIARAKKVHGDTYDYSNVIYVRSQENVIITCRTHGDFAQRPNTHTQGAGCRYCFNERWAASRRSNISEFIEKSNRKHEGKYDYSKVIYVGTSKKIIVICKTHGDFEIIPNSHIQGIGCRHCGRERTIAARTSNTKEFITKSNRIHEGKYDYSNVIYSGKSKNVIIICRTHGDFEQTPDTHLNGSGCNKCGIENAALLRRLTTSKFIANAEIVHNKSYDYTKVDYKSTMKKIIITCKLHGDFEQTPTAHLRGDGCIKCSILKKTISTDEFISRSNIIHGNKYDYSAVVYTGAHNYVSIICKTHGEFKQTPAQHTHRANGCPRCVPKYSKQQIAWLKFLSVYYNINIQHAENGGEYKVENIRADGFCPETHTIYEYHGNYWHGNPALYNPESINTKVNKTFGELYQKTIEREKRIVSLGFKLVTIWETDWLNLNKFVKMLQRKFRASRVTQ
jgi:hypothetical protein